MHPIAGRRAIFAWCRIRDTPHLGPLVSLDGTTDNPLTCVVSRRQPGDKQTSLSEVFLRDHRRVCDIDEHLIGDTMCLHVPGDLAQDTMVDLLVRGLAVLELADQRHIPLHAQQRQDKLFEVRALVLAIALSDLERRPVIVHPAIVTVETHRNRVKNGHDGSII
jgi:hypothetical protein